MDDSDERVIRYYTGEVAERATRALSPMRTQHLDQFVELCPSAHVRSVIEVGRDGRVIASAVPDYTGIDVTPTAVALCPDAGLDARVAWAQSLPFADGSFDAGWSMSTLMHLRALLSAVGDVTAFETWDRAPDGWHYQWARVLVS